MKTALKKHLIWRKYWLSYFSAKFSDIFRPFLLFQPLKSQLRWCWSSSARKKLCTLKKSSFSCLYEHLILIDTLPFSRYICLSWARTGRTLFSHVREKFWEIRIIWILRPSGPLQPGTNEQPDYKVRNDLKWFIPARKGRLFNREKFCACAKLKIRTFLRLESLNYDAIGFVYTRTKAHCKTIWYSSIQGNTYLG